MSRSKRNSWVSANSSYARPLRIAASVRTSSTSVTLRQVSTATPRAWATEATTSDQTNVAAWPRWVTSYGVIPHV